MNNNNQTPKQDNTSRDVILILGLVGCSLWYKYAHVVQLWFLDNMMKLVAALILILILCGYILYYRMQRKNKEEIKRMQRLSQAKAPTRNVDSFYKRPTNGRSLE